MDMPLMLLEQVALSNSHWSVFNLLVGEPDPKFGKVQGRRGTEGLTTDSYVKIPDGSESGLRLWT